jgi:hypothetical protein
MTTHTEADAAEKRYPIQDGPSVPWSYMTPHESTAVKNHGQTLQRLAERGGLGCGEAELIVTDQPLSPKEGEWNWVELKRRWIERAERVNNAWLETAQLRAENARLAADLAAARAERDRMREALAWAVGFIRCNLPKTSAGYEDMRNAEDLVKGVSMSGEFHRLSCRVELAEKERDALAKALSVLLDDTQHNSHDCGVKWCPVTEAKSLLARLAAPHLNPPAEGGAK